MNDTPNNSTRAGWAVHALNVFAQDTFNKPFTALCEEDRQDCVADLIGNLLHLLAHQGLDPAKALRCAVGNFAEERDDEGQPKITFTL